MTLSRVPSYFKKNRIDDFENWPESIKSTLKWFPFHEIIEYSGNVMQDDTHLTSSLLKMFSIESTWQNYRVHVLNSYCFHTLQHQYLPSILE